MAFVANCHRICKIVYVRIICWVNCWCCNALWRAIKAYHPYLIIITIIIVTNVAIDEKILPNGDWLHDIQSGFFFVKPMELAYIRRLTHKTWPYRPAIYSSSHWIFSVKKFHSILNICCCLFLLCCRFLCSHWHFIFDKSFFVFHLKCVRLFGCCCCCCHCFFTFLFDKQMTYIVSSWIGFINEFFRCFSFFWPKRKSNYLFLDWALVLGFECWVLVWFGLVLCI